MTRVASTVVRGQTLRAESWNDIIRRLRLLENILGAGQGAGVPGVVYTFTYVASDGDIIEATGLNYDLTAGATTYIAKPYTHRPSVTVRGGHTYAYTTDFERTDTLAGNAETQVLSLGYEAGDLIFAVRLNRQNGLTYNPGTGVLNVMWQQINVDGRSWAQKFGT